MKKPPSRVLLLRHPFGIRRDTGALGTLVHNLRPSLSSHETKKKKERQKNILNFWRDPKRKRKGKSGGFPALAVSRKHSNEMTRKIKIKIKRNISRCRPWAWDYYCVLRSTHTHPPYLMLPFCDEQQAPGRLRYCVRSSHPVPRRSSPTF